MINTPFDKFYRVAIILLLLGIHSMLVAIYIKMPEAPPTVGDLRKSVAKDKNALVDKKPLVHVTGHVDVDGSVYVDGTVDIGNTPLDVVIRR